MDDTEILDRILFELEDFESTAKMDSLVNAEALIKELKEYLKEYI